MVVFYTLCIFTGEIDNDVILEKDDFVIIMQTQFQSHLLKKFGNKGLCCDATHGTTGRSDVEVVELRCV